jgi:hypothetical protein
VCARASIVKSKPSYLVLAIRRRLSWVMSCSSLSPSFISCRCGAGAKSMIMKV